MPQEEKNPSGIHRSTKPVRLIEHKEDILSVEVAVGNSSKSMATLLDDAGAAALPDDVAAVTIIIDPTGVKEVRYNPIGTASPSNGAFFPATVYVIHGDKAKIDAAEFFAQQPGVGMCVIAHAGLDDGSP